MRGRKAVTLCLSLTIILSLLLSGLPTGSVSLAQGIVIDGIKEAAWGAPLALDPAGDISEPNLDLTGLYVVEDADNYYIGFDATASTWGMTYGIYIDTDMVDGSGATTDPWGRSVDAVSPHLPEHALYVWHDGGDFLQDVQLNHWTGSWSYDTLISQGGEQGYGPANDWIEYRVPKVALGSPASIALEVFTTGGDGHAQDTVPSDPNVAFADPDWDAGLITTLSAFVTFPAPSWYVAGDFNGWSSTADAMYDDGTHGDAVAGDGVHTAQIAVAGAGRHEFKVTNDDWSVSYPGSGNSWFDCADGETVTFTFDGNVHSDGWLPTTNIIGVSTEPGAWTAVGDWQGWNNGDPSTTMSTLGGGVYQLVYDMPTPGSYQYKAVKTGTWDAIGADGRSVNAATATFETLEANQTVSLTVDALGGRVNVELEAVLPMPAPDDNIWWAGLEHDSRDGFYRVPFGAVTTGTPITLRFRTYADDVTGVQVRVWDTALAGQTLYPMTRIATVPGTPYDYDVWDLELAAPGYLTVLYYRFIVTDGSDTDYYEDDDLLDGGLGQAYDSSPDYSWQIDVYDPAFTTPDWFQDAVVYQIFPDRFRNGIEANDPISGTFFYEEDPGVLLAPEWNWPVPDPRVAGKWEGSYSKLFYGGDLQGIIDKLDYLHELGINTLYLNPIFESPSNHKYDTTNYEVIDDNFGDLATFQALVAGLDARGMHLVLDGVFNHTSSDSHYFDRYGRYPGFVGACEDVNSPYRDWYYFYPANPPGTGVCAGDTTYNAWWGFDSLPKLNTTDEPGVRSYLYSDPAAIATYWLGQGADGWRLDVAGDVDHSFWEDWRAYILAADPAAITIAEEWGDASQFVLGDELDSTMNYRFRNAVIGLLRDSDWTDTNSTIPALSVSEFDRVMHGIEEDYPPQVWYTLMNLVDSHDTNRVLIPLDQDGDPTDADYSDGKARQRVLALIQMTMPGAPTIYYGDEVGLVGYGDAAGGGVYYADPYNRQPYPWPDEPGYAGLPTWRQRDTALRDYYQKLIKIRNNHPVLRTGSFDTLLVDDANQVYAYGRKDEATFQTAVVVVNRDSVAHDVTVDVSGYIGNRAQLADMLGGGTTYRVIAGQLTVPAVEAMSGKLLLLTWGDAQPPEAPTNLVAVEGNGQVSLDWDAMPDAVTYNVYRSYVAGGGYELLAQDVADSQYVDTSVTNGTWYYYVVTAVDDVLNESEPSDEAAALPHAPIGWAGNLEPTAITIVIGDPTPPILAQVWIDGVTNAPGPGEGVLAEVGYGPATVPYEDWDTWMPMSYVGEVGNNDQYQAIFTPEERGQFRYLARFSTTLGREWTYARTADGRIPILTVRQSGDYVPPRTPENLRLVDWGATFITLEWDPIIDDPTLYAYDLYRSDVSGVVGPFIGRVLAPDTTFTDTSVTSGETYYYVAQAVDTSFNRSGYSNEVEATAEAKLVNVTFEVTVPDWTPDGATVYIVGDIGEFCGWCNPQTVALNQINDVTWARSFSLPDGLAVQYKYTRGNWDINEWWGPIVGVNNRHMTVDYGTTGTQFIADNVPYWRDPLVIAHEPLDGAVDVDTSVAISVTLSRYLDPATIVADNLVVTNGTTTPTLDIAWYHHTNMTATTIIMTPQAPLDPGTLYDVTLGTGLAGLNSDNEGIHLQQPYTWSFTTADAPIVLNEFSASTTGTDVEYVEALGAANTDYSAYTILEIEGDSGNTGVVDEVIAVGSTDASGFWLGDLAANTLENGSISLLVVKNFSGAFGDDLDTDDDGTLDVTPWDVLVDGVSVNDGGAGDLTYGVPELGPNYDGVSTYAPGGASRYPDGTDTDTAADWVRNDFDLAGIPGYTGTIAEGEAYNTPGAPNQIYVYEPPAPLLNEFSASTTGTDVEYVEVLGAASTDYSAYTILEIEGDSGNTGVVDEVIAVGSTDASGFWLGDLAANTLENGSISLLLVKNFSGAFGDDLDTDDDGTLDVTPWEALVDGVSVNDGGAGDLTYGVPELGPNYDGVSTYAPGGASRYPDGTDTDTAADWVRNDFDLAGIPGYTGTIVAGEAYNTPGAPNEIYVEETPVLNEFSASTTGTDVEYVEVLGAASTDYSAYTILEIEGDSGNTGVVDEVIAVGSTDAGGFWLGDLAANTLENGSISLLLVKNFSGAFGDDLDTDDDGTLDVTPWETLVDGVSVNDGGAGDLTYGVPELGPNYDGVSTYAPGGASRYPDGTDTDTAADWVRNDFDLAGIPGYTGTIVAGEAYNTPGAPNEIYVEETPVLNEFSASTTGTDVEYVEVLGAASTDYSAYTILEIEGDSGNTGVVDEVIAVGSTDAGGFWLGDLAANTLENGSISLLVVKNFSGAFGDDLDTDDDGTLDVTPWEALVDGVSVNDGGAGDLTYGVPELGPNYDGVSTYAPGGASRYPDGTDTDTAADWVRNDFDLAGIPGYTGTLGPGEALNTPGAPNQIYVEATPVLNEFSASTTGTDVEYVEVYASPNTDYSAYTILEIEGDSGNTGVVDEVIAVGSTDASGFWLGDLAANTLENGSISLLLVQNFSGAFGDDLDTDDDGTLDVTPWDVLVDGVSVNDGGAGDLTYGVPALTVGYDGLSYAPGGASRYPDGTDTDTTADWVRNDFDLAGIPGYTGTLVLGEAYNTPGAPNEIYVPPTEACGDPYTYIYEVQGDGLASPLAGTEVSVEGIVVGDFQNNAEVDDGDLNGFHIQDPDGDANPATSDGVFIYAAGAADVSVGDRVRVHGTVSEYNGLTEITLSQLWDCGTGTVPTPTSISLPVTTWDEMEPYEGMLVTLPQTLYLAEYYNFDRFGEIMLSTDRQIQPTAIYEPGSPEQAALALQNSLSRITLDDGRTSENPDPAIHPNGSVFDMSNLFRGGDTVQNVTGVMDYAFGLYRIQPTQGADYTSANPRAAAPDAVGGSLKVASFNVLNYFTTIDTGDWICGPSGDMECRGADTPEELTRQRDKIIAALVAIDADIVGLIEIENHATNAPTADLVAGLNDVLGAGTYDYIATGFIGTDAIEQALIYKPAAVTPLGAYAILDSTVDPTFLDTYNRPVLAQSFQDNAAGGILTVAVNHLKSKGSDCNAVGDPDLGDGAGNCNLTRTSAAVALANWLAGDPTSSGDGDFLIIGDLNSYDKEDPIDALLAGDYTDLIYHFLGEYAYSYLFDSQLGYLDHALANVALFGQVTGVTVWHINADEPDLIDYDMTYKQDAQDALYAPDAYRASDHDPVIVGLSLTP